MIEKEIGREIEMERNNWRELREREREKNWKRSQRNLSKQKE